MPVAVNCWLVLTGIEEDAGETAIDFKFAAAAAMDSVADAWALPVCAVIVALPAATAFASPFALTEATLASEDVHLTVLLTSPVVPSEKFAVAKNCFVAPGAIDTDPGETCSDNTVGVLLGGLFVV